MNIPKLMLFAIFALAIVGDANSTTKISHSGNAQKSQAISLKNSNMAAPIWERSTRVAQSLPDCSTIAGNYCSTPYARARCYVYQYQEPMVCVCQPDNVWFCN